MKKKLEINLANQSAQLTRLQFLSLKFKEFCQRTDLHGFKYITMGGLSVAERCVWTSAVMVSIVGAVLLVITAYSWYALNPIVTVVESTQGVIWDIPFPAVTVCDLNLVSRKAASILSNELTLPTNVTAEIMFKIFKLAPLLHSLNKADQKQKRDLRLLQHTLDKNHMSVEMLFRKLSPATDCSNLMDRCMWKSSIYHCNQIFRHVFVAVQLCCTFNYYAVEDEYNELKIFRFLTPRRVASCGYQTALTAILKSDPTDYHSTMFASHGTLVYVDNAYNVPDLNTPMRIVNPATEMVIAVSAERTYATPGIRAFSAEERKCYYTDEITITNINQYSFHNCMALRKVQTTAHVCGCVPFYFPKKDNYRICNFRDVECLETAMNLTIDGSTPANVTFESTEEAVKSIKCLPECEHFSYPLQVALGTVTDRTPLTGISFFRDVDLKNKSVMNVFFNDLVATRFRRDVYLNWQNVLAAFGGLLSLMLGFTLVSVVDFVLFFSCRVICEWMKSFFKRDKNDGRNLKVQGYTINVEHVKKDWVKKTRKHKKYTNESFYRKGKRY